MTGTWEYFLVTVFLEKQGELIKGWSADQGNLSPHLSLHHRVEGDLLAW